MAKKKNTRSFMSRWLLWAAIAGAVGCGLVAGGGFYVWRHIYRPHVDIDTIRYPVLGIDVSKHNGDIDFQKVAGSHVRFVMIKATEGSQLKDNRFATNYSNARQAGLTVGAYHYFRFDVDGTDQANHFVASLKDHKLDLPLVIDVEDWGNAKGVATNIVISRLDAMIARLKELGLRVMIYTNQDGYRKYISKSFADELLWLCAFKQPEDIACDWKFLQYSHWGSVAGIDTDVDLNVFSGSEEEWQLLLNGNFDNYDG